MPLRADLGALVQTVIQFTSYAVRPDCEGKKSPGVTGASLTYALSEKLKSKSYGRHAAGRCFGAIAVAPDPPVLQVHSTLPAFVTGDICRNAPDRVA